MAVTISVDAMVHTYMPVCCDAWKTALVQVHDILIVY